MVNNLDKKILEKPDKNALGIGVCFFVVFCLVFDSLALGVALGIALGVAYSETSQKQAGDSTENEQSDG